MRASRWGARGAPTAPCLLRGANQAAVLDRVEKKILGGIACDRRVYSSALFFLSCSVDFVIWIYFVFSFQMI